MGLKLTPELLNEFYDQSGAAWEDEFSLGATVTHLCHAPCHDPPISREESSHPHRARRPLGGFLGTQDFAFCRRLVVERDSSRLSDSGALPLLAGRRLDRVPQSKFRRGERHGETAAILRT